MGVPLVGGQWGDCDPNNPRNRRRRCSLLVERKSASGTTRVLVDCSPDLREQLLSANVDDLDGVLITHEHADHISGFIDANFHDIQIDDLWLGWTEDPADTNT